MSNSFSHIIGFLVQAFFFSAVFVGIALHIRPDFFQNVVIPPSAPFEIASNPFNHSSTTERRTEAIEKSQIFHQEILSKVASFDPFVAFIPAVDETKKTVELPFVFISHDRDYLMAKAIEFCLENYHLLSITDLSKIQSQCVATIVDTVSARIKVGKIFTFQEILRRAEERSQQTSASASSEETSNAKDISRVPGTQSNYAIRIHSSNGQFYDVTFDLQNTSPKKIAQYFCAQKAKELKMTTPALLTTCSEQVEEYVLQKLKEINAQVPEHMLPSSSSTPSSPETQTQTTETEALSSRTVLDSEEATSNAPLQ